MLNVINILAGWSRKLCMTYLFHILPLRQGRIGASIDSAVKEAWSKCLAR